MEHLFLFYIASAFLFFWGIAHLIPTKSVVGSFGDISKDNRLIITMEWIIEGITLIFTGVLICVITLLNSYYEIARFILSLIAAFLVLMALISFFTGFRVKFLPFRLCPFIFISSALLILIGLLL